MTFYLIERPVDNCYIHFNPKTNTYFVDDKKLGAALFHEEDGNKFIKAELDHEWQLSIVSPTLTIKASRTEESKYFDKTH